MFFKVIITSLMYLITGVAYSKHIVQLYSYSGGDDIRQQLEVCCDKNNANIVVKGFLSIYAILNLMLSLS